MSRWRNDTESPEPSGEFRAVIERYEQTANQCTVFPADADRDESRTAWLTAEEPAFVHLSDCR